MRFPKFLSLLLVLLLGLVGAAQAVEVTEGPVVVVSENAAAFEWSTDVECGTQLKFGVNQNNYNHKVQGGVGLRHAVQAAGLLPGTQYFYSIGTAKKSLKEGAFTTKGVAPAGAAVQKVPPPSAPPVPSAKPAAKPSTPPSTAAGKPVYAVPPTAKTWGDRYSLLDHFNRHGADFGAANADDYAAKAWLFLQQVKDEGLPAKQDESDGTIRVWDGKTHTFAAYNRNFTTKTFFKPLSADYFNRQPGKPVRLRHPTATP